MKAIILAAGEGHRLRPLTDHCPKCLVELDGTPLIDRHLNVLRSEGVEDITVVGGYLAEQLDVKGIKLEVNSAYATTNMVSTLFCASSEMVAGEDLIIAYGDIVYEPRVLRTLLDCKAPLCISVDVAWRQLWHLRMDDPLSDAETLRLDDTSRIVELGKKPNSYDDIQGQYMGLMKVRGDYVESFRAVWQGMDRDATYDGRDFDNMYMTSYLQHLIDAGWEARACFTSGGWLEVDTVEDLDQYHNMKTQGTLNTLIRLD